MRTLTLTILAMGIVWAAGDAQAQTYDPSVPVCMHVVYPRGGTYQDCSYHTMAQCAASASGTLDVSCNGQDDEVVIMWTERGGPPISAPATLEGFGSKLLHRSMAAQLGGSIDYDWSAEGVVATLRMSKDRMAK